jgi:hypothetical protein
VEPGGWKAFRDPKNKAAAMQASGNFNFAAQLMERQKSFTFYQAKPHRASVTYIEGNFQSAKNSEKLKFKDDRPKEGGKSDKRFVRFMSFHRFAKRFVSRVIETAKLCGAMR